MYAIPELWGWPNFTPAELACKHTGCLIVVPAFMSKLQALRSALAFPFPISSGYRHTSHPAERHKPLPGAHSFARAVDIAVSGVEALAIVERARAFGFTGIGVSQPNGSDGQRFIHLDDMTAADGYHAARPAFWSY
ncbi:D-Ala-D-Ala carboxypeptidase family metallohydrolase [Thalassobaculum sp.]|uniref:D-Ala-D-Ala carboxypeptidase family metallohydrolase n=1 Tax=Thalassobaculum sp. TaxID=2022740 RepID=UPI0032EF38CC